MAIQVLADQVASQIAAGEVVERPASVIRELLENALDAGAKRIQIRIEDAGQRLMEVDDDGQGILSDELHLAVTHHATSKLRQADDLNRITSLGFRGEALASIASISELTLLSRAEGAPVGARIRVNGGKAGVPEAMGSSIGTRVSVENLFFNVPARLKFLKSKQTERQQIDGLVIRYAAAYPDVRFSLTQDGRTIIDSAGDGDRRVILASLFGFDTASRVLEVDYRDEEIGVSGFISPINLTRGSRRDLTFFVNGRWVQNTALSSALLQAYHSFLMVGRFPVAVLFLELDPQTVDVNVHPAKSEVRFRDQDAVFSAVQRAVRRALLAHSPVPEVPGGNLWSDRHWSGATGGSTQVGLDWTMAASFDEDAGSGAGEADPAVLEPEGLREPSLLPSGSIPLLRLVGQVGAAYLVAEGPDGLYLIDQHAAHERILFERLMGQGEKSAAQSLMEPVLVQVNSSQMDLLRGNLDVLRRLGFDIEEFGNSTLRIRAIPADLTGSDPAAALRSLVEDFEEDEEPLRSQREARIIARICKRSAVKAGQVLSPEEQKRIVHDLEACQAPRTCPHGRPTMIHLPVGILERQFGRKGAR